MNYEMREKRERAETINHSPFVYFASFVLDYSAPPGIYTQH